MELTDLAEEEFMKKWQELLGPSNEVMVSSLAGVGGWRGGCVCADGGSCPQVAQVEKFSESSGLGISLEASSGHHYIRSVLPEGPVGRCGKLFSGDELLEVSHRGRWWVGQRLEDPIPTDLRVTGQRNLSDW